MKKSLIALVLMALLAAACNLPGNGGTATQESPEAIFTQAAQTVAAELTRVALLASPTPNRPILPTSTFTPIATDTPIPTNTPIYTPTNTPIPCNLATFVIDVTVPDNTPMAPNQVFTKTWRIHNAGSCSWNSSYLLIFDHGDGMGVTAGYTQQLTTGVVNPGQEVDLNVNLKAPAAIGTYAGYWRLRDPGGTVFGITPAGDTFIVKIMVVATTSVTLLPVVGESGTILSDSGPGPDFTAGESNADITRTCEAFLSFNITSIPTNATITEVKVDFTAFTITGNPFGLGVLNAYATDYGPTLESSDFVSGFPPGNIADWGSTGTLNVIEASPELKTYLQSKLGTSRLQLRLQFPGSNGDAVKDRLTLTNPRLIVTYATP
jgi:hypothetical protein